jgi:hypothetical protein
MHLVRKNGLAVGPVRGESGKGVGIWAGLRWFQDGLRGGAKIGRKQMRVMATLRIGGNKRLMLVSCVDGRTLARSRVADTRTAMPVRPVLVATRLVGVRKVCESANPRRLGDGIGRAVGVGS